MTNTSDGYFDETIAATYDEDERESFTESEVLPIVDVLATLVKAYGAVEFGVGTGRNACPLALRGISVTGIDMSQAMLDRTSGKPGAGHITLVQGDFSATRVTGRFDLVYLIFNTIMNLTSQEEQIACFQNAADHLVPGGHFVIEVMTPRLQWLNPGEKQMIWDFSDDHWGIDEYDIATQQLTSHHTRRKNGTTTINSIPCRYVWPAELDLMARLANMKLRSRWQDWAGGVFQSDSPQHVSIWQKC